MNSTMTLAEMANSTNYATMNYAQLTELDFAFNWAIGQIKTLIPIKRREEMEMVTKTYVTVMNGYCATKEEILDCILKEEDNLKNESVFNMDSKDVDDQDAAVVSQEEKMDNGGTLPALPEAPRPNKLESEVVSSQDDNAEKPQNNETVPPENKEKTVIEKALEKAMARPVKEGIDIHKPYFIDVTFDIDEKGKLVCTGSNGHNLESEELEVFKSAGEKYVEFFMKDGVIETGDDYLVYHHKDIIVVRIYHHSVESNDRVESVDSSSSKCVSEKDMKMRAKKRAIMTKAIEKAKKDALEEEDASTPFLYKCGLQHGKGFLMINRRLPKEYKDVATLVEMKKAVEVYAKYYFANAEVMSNEDGVAVMREDKIEVIFFNIPINNDGIEPPIKSTLGKKEKKSVKKDTEKKTTGKTETNKKKRVDSINTPKKDPRCIAIIGTKDGDTKTWNSFKECEVDLGAGHGTVSQFFSGKMKSVKGWILEKIV